MNYKESIKEILLIAQDYMNMVDYMNFREEVDTKIKSKGIDCCGSDDCPDNK